MSESEGVSCRTRSVYLALAELANDAGEETFSETKALIAYRAGLSTRTVQRVLRDLERIGLITVHRSTDGMRTKSSYTLLSVSALLGQDGSTSGHGVLTSSQISGSGHVADKVEEPTKNNEESIAPTSAGACLGARPIDPTSKSPPDSKTHRTRNPLIDALVVLDGSDLTQATRAAFGRAAKALSEIRTVMPDVTADEIRRRARNYSTHFTVICTSTALATHWALCDRPTQDERRAAEPTVRVIQG